MKIISKKGNVNSINSKWSRKFTCDHCKTVLKVEANDLSYGYYINKITTLFFDCCECKRTYFFNTNEVDIPNKLLLELKRNHNNRPRPKCGNYGCSDDMCDCDRFNW